MIYLVTNNPPKTLENNIKIIDVETSLKLLEPLNKVGLDTETSGLNCHLDLLKSLQLGCFDFQIVIDCLSIDIALYKSYIESERLFIGANLKFDLGFLYKNNIWPKNLFDVYLAEKLMWLGYPIRMSIEEWEYIKNPRYTAKFTNNGVLSYYLLEMNLKKLGEIYLNIELDKSVRGKIIYEGLTQEVIEYAANDVKYLELLMDAQLKALEEKNLQVAIKYENAFLLPLAYMEFCGIKLDQEKWKNKMAIDSKKRDECLDLLNKWIVDNCFNSKYVYVDTQGDLFTGFDLTPKVTINWNSNKQLVELFKSLGVEVGASDSDESIGAKVLKPQKDKCSLIPIYLEYKELTKLTSTYGQNFLDQINPKTGRIHTKFQSIGTDTGRISSGGQEKDGTQLINLLNIPSDPNTRSCFIAEDGNRWISIDYSG